MTYSIREALEEGWIVTADGCHTPKCERKALYYFKDEGWHLCKDCTEEMLLEYWTFDQEHGRH